MSDATQRQQIKWVVLGMAVALGGFLVFPLVDALLPGVLLASLLANTAYFVFPLFIPMSIAIAILRYRLYDIDIIINRTIVYGSLTVTLVALYFGVVVVLQRIFVLLTGQQSTLAVVASTLAIAALFSPLRRRIQGLEAAPIGGQPFAQDISRRDCTAFLLLFDTYDTRLLAQALS